MKEQEQALNDQTGGKMMDFSGQLVRRENVEGTDFTVVTVEQGSFVAMGNVALTEMKSEEECHQLIKEKAWELLGAWVLTLAASGEVTRRIETLQKAKMYDQEGRQL